MKAPWIRKLAWFSVFASLPVWLAAFMLPPFLPLDLAEKAIVAAVLFGLGELMFWGPALILGTEFANRFRTPKVRTGSSFSGRRVAVIGANGGLGGAIARALHREGAELVLIGRDAHRLARVELADRLHHGPPHQPLLVRAFQVATLLARAPRHAGECHTRCGGHLRTPV
jgi:hypothetical protein